MSQGELEREANAHCSQAERGRCSYHFNQMLNQVEDCLCLCLLAQIQEREISGDCGEVSRCEACDPQPAWTPKSGRGR